MSNAPTATIVGLSNPVASPSAPYRQALDAAWLAHMAPRAEDAPTVISLFAGAGGSSLGYSMAGFRELLAVEWEDDAASTFSRNFPDVPLYHGDISLLEVDEVLRLTGILPGELDVLDGSPPCQGFSTAGRRQMDDERNQLFRQYLRLLEGLRPKVFVMENVSGMVKGSMKLLFVEILRALKRTGYTVTATLASVMYYGVPQDRDRVIFIGLRPDLANGKVPCLPPANSAPITFAEACYDLKGNAPDDRPLAEIVKACALYQPNTWSTSARVYGHFKGAETGSFNLMWAGWNRVCGTIVKSEIALGGIVHPDRERYISLAEAKRVASFPDQFTFTDRKHGIARIGNSVPPLFMRAIATHIRREYLTPVHNIGSA